MNYSVIAIIYNPNSTGPSQSRAKELRKDLKQHFSKIDIKLYPTRYPGHAEKIAHEIASSSIRPLIVSASGDGGYNEVINGALRAQTKGAQPVCAVLASGNANDHSRTLHQESLFTLIQQKRPRKLDVLEISFHQKNKRVTRYAHSYIGLGLTPTVAIELNKSSLNALKELWIIVRTFYKYRPFKIRRGGKTLQLDSIVFANIGEMAKVLKIAKQAKPNDGLLEVVMFPHAHKLRLIRKISRAVVQGIEPAKQAKTYRFTVLKKMPVQLDGEVSHIDKGSAVTISCKHKALRTII